MARASGGANNVPKLAENFDLSPRKFDIREINSEINKKKLKNQ